MKRLLIFIFAILLLILSIDFYYKNSKVVVLPTKIENKDFVFEEYKLDATNFSEVIDYGYKEVPDIIKSLKLKDLKVVDYAITYTKTGPDSGIYLVKDDVHSFTIKRDSSYSYKVYVNDILIDEPKLVFGVTDPIKYIIKTKNNLYIQYASLSAELNGLDLGIINYKYDEDKKLWIKKDFRDDKTKEAFGLNKSGNKIVYFTKKNNTYYINVEGKVLELKGITDIANKSCCAIDMDPRYPNDSDILFYSLKNNNVYFNKVEIL